MDGFIKTEGLYFWYNNEENQPNIVLDNINLSIKQGEFVCIIGHNGSGKSTLAKTFNTILLPMGGKVYVDEMDTSDEKLFYDIRQNVGMVFQNPDNQIVATVVEEDVAFAPENLGVPTEIIRERVDYALKAVNMYDYKEHSSHLLSGGQKQRVAIAGVIAMKPKCLVLDEPTAMLDPKGRKEVIETIRKLNKEDGITIVLITHFMNEATLSDRVVVLNNGTVLLDGTPKDVFQNAGLLKSVGLDVPQTTELMFALREKDIKVPLAVLTSDECIEVLTKYLKNEK